MQQIKTLQLQKKMRESSVWKYEGKIRSVYCVDCHLNVIAEEGNFKFFLKIPELPGT